MFFSPLFDKLYIPYVYFPFSLPWRRRKKTFFRYCFISYLWQNCQPRNALQLQFTAPKLFCLRQSCFLLLSAPSPVTGVTASKRYLSRAEKEERRGVEIVSVTHTGDGYEMDDRKGGKAPARERERAVWSPHVHHHTTTFGTATGTPWLFVTILWERV